jgi:hypothetical protein
MRIQKKEKKGKCELVYLTLTVVLTGGDKAVGLSTDSQTNAVAVYAPASEGIHDNAGLND